ncbi:hypothetical protein KI387_001736, partial [Taxus chinensis]
MAMSGKGLKIEEIEVSADEEETYAHLHPVINTSPYTVMETMSLAKTLILFRHVGLHHLCVVPKEAEGLQPSGRIKQKIGMLLHPRSIIDNHPKRAKAMNEQGCNSFEILFFGR